MAKSTMQNPERIPRDTKPCPFCGELPSCFHWHGGARTKRMVSCENEECAVAPSVTGETKVEALAYWNQRVDQ